MVIGIVSYGWAVEYWNDYQREQAKTKTRGSRTRHRSGLDENLLKCENNYHWWRAKQPDLPTIKVEDVEEVKPGYHRAEPVETLPTELSKKDN